MSKKWNKVLAFLLALALVVTTFGSDFTSARAYAAAEDEQQVEATVDTTEAVEEADAVEDTATEEEKTLPEIFEILDEGEKLESEEVTPVAEETVVAEEDETVKETTEEAKSEEDADEEDEENVEESADAEEAEEAEDAEEASEEKAEASDYVFDASQETGDGLVVALHAENGVIPEGSTFTVSRVPSPVEDQIKDTIDALDQEYQVVETYSYDITIYSKDGAVIEPENGTVQVTFSNVSLTKDDEVDVYHTEVSEGNVSVEEVTSSVEGSDVVFDAPHFSVYTVTIKRYDLGFLSLVNTVTTDFDIYLYDTNGKKINTTKSYITDVFADWKVDVDELAANAGVKDRKFLKAYYVVKNNDFDRTVEGIVSLATLGIVDLELADYTWALPCNRVGVSLLGDVYAYWLDTNLIQIPWGNLKQGKLVFIYDAIEEPAKKFATVKYHIDYPDKDDDYKEYVYNITKGKSVTVNIPDYNKLTIPAEYEAKFYTSDKYKTECPSTKELKNKDVYDVYVKLTKSTKNVDIKYIGVYAGEYKNNEILYSTTATVAKNAKTVSIKDSVDKVAAPDAEHLIGGYYKDERLTQKIDSYDLAFAHDKCGNKDYLYVYVKLEKVKKNWVDYYCIAPDHSYKYIGSYEYLVGSTVDVPDSRFQTPAEYADYEVEGYYKSFQYVPFVPGRITGANAYGNGEKITVEECGCYKVFVQYKDSKVKVTYHANYGNDATKTYEVKKNTKNYSVLTYNEVFTNSYVGHTFDGWYYADGTKKVTKIDSVNADVDLYAHWKANTITAKYYNNNDAKIGDTYTFTFNDEFPVPAANSFSYVLSKEEEKQGYKSEDFAFDGWDDLDTCYYVEHLTAADLVDYHKAYPCDKEFAFKANYRKVREFRTYDVVYMYEGADGRYYEDFYYETRNVKVDAPSKHNPNPYTEVSVEQKDKERTRRPFDNTKYVLNETLTKGYTGKVYYYSCNVTTLFVFYDRAYHGLKMIVQAPDDEKVYDGTKLTVADYKAADGKEAKNRPTVTIINGRDNKDVTDEFKIEILSVKYESNVKNVADSGEKNVIKSYKIKVDGEIYTEKTNTMCTTISKVNTLPGTLTVTPKALTLKSATIRKYYDGKDLENGKTALETEEGWVVVDGVKEGANYDFTAVVAKDDVNNPTANAFTVNPYTAEDVANDPTIAVTDINNYAVDKQEGILEILKSDQPWKLRVTINVDHDGDNYKTVRYDGTEKELNVDVTVDIDYDAGSVPAIPLIPAIRTEDVEESEDNELIQVLNSALSNMTTSIGSFFTITAYAADKEKVVELDPVEKDITYNGITSTYRVSGLRLVGGSGVDYKEGGYPINLDLSGIEVRVKDGDSWGPNIASEVMELNEIIKDVNSGDDAPVVRALSADETPNTEIGKLTILRREGTLQANSGTFEYTGSPVKLDSYQILNDMPEDQEGKLLADGHVLNVTFVENTNPGSASQVTTLDNLIASWSVTDAEGNNQSANYDIKTLKGLITINPLPPQNNPNPPSEPEPPTPPQVLGAARPLAAAPAAGEVLGAQRQGAVLGARRGRTEDPTNNVARIIVIVVAAGIAISIMFFGRKKEDSEE